MAALGSRRSSAGAFAGAFARRSAALTRLLKTATQSHGNFGADDGGYTLCVTGG